MFNHSFEVTFNIVPYYTLNYLSVPFIYIYAILGHKNWKMHV